MMQNRSQFGGKKIELRKKKQKLNKFLKKNVSKGVPPIIQDSEDPHPSLSDFTDYEPNLEFDDTELSQAPAPEDDLVGTFDEDSFASGESTRNSFFLLLNRNLINSPCLHALMYARSSVSDEVTDLLATHIRLCWWWWLWIMFSRF